MTHVNDKWLFRSALIVLIFSMVFLFSITGYCAGVAAQCIEGDGGTAQLSRQLIGFDQVVIQGAYTVTINRGDEIECVLRGDENLLSRVMTQVENGQLLIRNEGSLRLKQPLEIKLQVPHLRSLTVNGAHEITIVDIDESRFVLTLNGASFVNVSGRADVLQLQLDGSSILDASNLTVTSALVSASGTTSVQLNIDRSLTVKASGISEVIYSGEPKSVDVNLSGLAEMRTKE